MGDGDPQLGDLSSYVDLEQRMPAGHVLRKIRAVVNTASAGICPDLEALHWWIGQPSITPEMRPRTPLLQLFYGIRPERQMMEWLGFDLLFRWFVGFVVGKRMWTHRLFENRDRLLAGEIATRFLSSSLAMSRVR